MEVVTRIKKEKDTFANNYPRLDKNLMAEKEKKEGFAITYRPLFLRWREVGQAAFMFYNFLCTFRDKTTCELVRLPKWKEMAATFGVKPNVVSMWLKTLVEWGWVVEFKGKIFAVAGYENELKSSNELNLLEIASSNKLNKSSDKLKSSSNELNKSSNELNSSYKDIQTSNNSNLKHVANATGETPNKKKKSKVAKLEKDPRSKHPAILAIRGLMRSYPDEILWDKIIARFGTDFNQDLLRSCRETWVERGYNRSSTSWLNWYFDGIPERNGNKNAPSKQQLSSRNDSDSGTVRDRLRAAKP